MTSLTSKLSADSFYLILAIQNFITSSLLLKPKISYLKAFAALFKGFFYAGFLTTFYFDP